MKAGAVILFHLPRTAKESLAVQAKAEGKSLTGLLNDLIAAYITASARPPKKKTGRGNVDLAQVGKAKEILRLRHPRGVSAAEIARHVGCRRDRAERLLDILSGNASESAAGFLVYEDDSSGRPLFGIAKDAERGASAGECRRNAI